MTYDDRKQWNEGAESWVEFVRSGKNYYSEYLNGPALKRMIGDVEGKKVLDMGCGEGYCSRFFAKAGAEVTGIDLSEALIKAAVEEEERNPLGIKYFAADVANLNMLESESFDVAFCYMALLDIRNYEGAISEASRVLKTGGRFVVLIEHPCFTLFRVLDGKVVSGWETRVREDGSKEYVYYWIADYLRRHSYTVEWKHDRLPSSFVTTGFHRPLSDYVNALTKHGLAITGLDEPQPLEEGVRVHPPMKKHYRVPQSMVIEATKITGQRALG
jgi:2-polyprenyl-3-methyl-5-hydroxy-6-metoxy-1,4-benzoquinol methylase